MLFRVSHLTFIQKQSIVLDYNIQILQLKDHDKIFLAGPLGNYSLAGFQMVRCISFMLSKLDRDEPESQLFFLLALQPFMIAERAQQD